MQLNMTLRGRTEDKFKKRKAMMEYYIHQAVFFITMSLNQDVRVYVCVFV